MIWFGGSHVGDGDGDGGVWSCVVLICDHGSMAVIGA